MQLNLYSFFHLNLAYSAIKESDRPTVIEKCYWPLLRIADELNIPLGIELSAYTLEVINKIDSGWIEKFKILISEGKCELIGCGYSQIIGPLVPERVNCQNLILGNQVYLEIMGVQPKIALINEQAFSEGLVENYKKAGYESIIMEWNNPAKSNFTWSPEYKYYSQKVKGNKGSVLNLIWNESISFQKFQRYVHGELELDYLIDYLLGHMGKEERCFSVYGNDVEVFDFRPGRYMTEAAIQDSEWDRIRAYYKALSSRREFNLISVGEVLEYKNDSLSHKLVNLSSASNPIPVKKQDKYNVTRWAVSGRNDFDINTRCWRLYKKIISLDMPSEIDFFWKTLCYLWSSDFRTHITENRWKHYLLKLTDFERQIDDLIVKQDSCFSERSTIDTSLIPSGSENLNVSRTGNKLHVEGENISLVLNINRGLSIDSFCDKSVSSIPLLGTLDHGYFDDIAWSADFYSGHLVLEQPGEHKITDLTPVSIDIINNDAKLNVSAVFDLAVCQFKKTWVVDDSNKTVTLKLSFESSCDKKFVLRFLNLTFFDSSFNMSEAYFKTNNGGGVECFKIGGVDFDYGSPVSSLVTSNQCLGLTNGSFEYGDDQKSIVVEFDNELGAFVGLFKSKSIQGKKLHRFSLTASEIDDSSKVKNIKFESVEIRFFANSFVE